MEPASLLLVSTNNKNVSYPIYIVIVVPSSKVIKIRTDEVFQRVDLVEPTDSGYIVIAAEVDRRPPFLWTSHTKRQLLKDLVRRCRHIAQQDDVIRAVTFKAFFKPPGRGNYLKKRPDLHVADFDVVLLIETVSIDRAERLSKCDAVKSLKCRIRSAANHTCLLVAKNVRRIGAVDHSSEGVFLFNFFVANDVEQNIDVWEYTAGWFQQQTGLDNSTVLLPRDQESSDYAIINHCRWDHLHDVLPALLFKWSFRSYVLAHFEANQVAAIPILYRIAGGIPSPANNTH